VLSGLWTNDSFSYEGRHYTIDGARLVPKPAQSPAPPLWIGATSIPGVRRAGRRGAHLLGLANRRLQHEYDEARQAAGHDLDSAKVLQLHWAHVAATDDAAWDEAAPHYRHLLEVYTGWLNEADDPGNIAGAVQVPALEDLRTARTLFVPAFGSPESVASRLAASAAKVRTTHLALGVLPGMSPDKVAASLERFAHDVAPALGR
jgi:alkanesulfonate monooxygenase SsuD/methylene tetrahydromethanopterin reductase-like flavin-dependent oxidoreductase (luciferase family)